MNPDRIRIALRILPFVVGGLAIAGIVRLHYGDGLGIFERNFRGAIGAWDMWTTDMVRPYEVPMVQTPDGMVSIDGPAPDHAEALARTADIDPAARPAAAAEAYRRYCRHCHGDNGDGRIIVGESFPFELPDLRADSVQSRDPALLFDQVTDGSARMIPLAEIVPPEKRVLAIEHVKTLGDAPSVPFFDRRWVEPAEQPGGPTE